MLIGAKIREIRAEKGVSRFRLSKDTGIPYSTLVDLESGRIKDITATNLKKVSNALNVSIEELLKELSA